MTHSIFPKVQNHLPSTKIYSFKVFHFSFLEDD